MKINLAWLADLVDLPADRKRLFEAINTQLGEIEAVEDLAAKYKGALIVKVVRIEDHPQAQKLKICLIDDARSHKTVDRSKDGLIQVVCGADNLKRGMFACWLPPQSVVPNTLGKPSPEVLKVLEIRGVKSWGMLASAFELDLSGDYEGILELRSDRQRSADYPAVTVDEKSVGQPFAAVFGLETAVLDIDNKMFTHRPDCFGLLGVAREIAAITQSAFRAPAWYGLPTKEKTVSGDKKLLLDIQTPQLARRFRALFIDGLEVQPPDLSLQFRLASLGIKPVNNVVDWTNYLMYLTGQPSHAFDYDKLLKLSGSAEPLKLIVRQSRRGESLLLLNGKKLTFDQPALVIATDRQPVALAGVMGGSETEVDQNTKTVLLECANFDMYDLWRTSMRYGIFSEAATRFTKGQSPWQIPAVAQATAEAIAQDGSGLLKPVVYELWDQAAAPRKALCVHLDFINRRLGSSLAFQTVIDLLERVEFEVSLKTEQTLEIKPPFWRTDIAIAEDIVEEIGRLNGGYQALEPVLPRRSMQAAAVGELLKLKSKIRNCLAARGANEVMGYSFVSEAQLQAGNQDVKASFKLLNPLNPQLEAYRQSLTPSLIAMAQANQRQGYKDFALFEIDCGHLKDAKLTDEEGLPLDLERSALLCSLESGRNRPFYTARRYLDLIARNFKLEFEYQAFDGQSSLDPSLTAVYNLEQSALVRVNQADLGIVGFLKDYPAWAAWEIKTDVLLQASRQAGTVSTYRAISRYPKSSQDLTLRMPLSCRYQSLKQVFDRAVEDYRKQDWQIAWELIGIYRPPENRDFKHLTFRWQLAHRQKTAAKGEVLEVIKALVEACRRRDAKIEQVV